MRTLLQSIVVGVATLGCGLAAAQDCQLREPKGATGKAQVLAQEASKTNPCKAVPGLTARTLASMWDILQMRKTIGGKRFEGEPPDGTPTGKILPGRDGVTFDLQAIAAQGVTGLRIASAGVPVFTAATPFAASILVPAARLAPGRSYDWVVTTRSTAYRGSFELPDADETALIQARLAALGSQQFSPALRLLYAAAIFDDAELYQARDQALSALRAETAQ